MKHEYGNIVVTGGSGFVGRTVCAMLREIGVNVVSLSRREGVDLRDPAATARFLRRHKPVCVVHCAAHMGGIGYVRENGLAVYADNLRIALGLLEGMEAANIGNLVTVMPNCTYPGSKHVFTEEEWWDGPLHESVMMYGLPRKALWGYCWAFQKLGRIRSAHLVLPNLYGPGDHFDPVRSHALGAIIARVVEAHRLGETRVMLWGTGRPIREWLYVEDAARSICAFLSEFADRSVTEEISPIYNVGVGQGISIADLARKVRHAVGWDGEFLFDSSQTDGAAKKVLDGARFASLTGWKPAIELDEGISRTVAWYRENCVASLLAPA